MIKKKKIYTDYEKNVQNYFNDISNLNSLSRDEELALWKEFKNNNNLEARNKIVSANLKFVANIAKSYIGRGLSYSDLIAEGNLGLIKAMDKYDAEKGFKTISYSVWWIRQTILEALNKRNTIDSEDLPKEFENQPEEYEDIFTKDNNKTIPAPLIENVEKLEKEREEKDIISCFIGYLNNRERKIVTEYYGLDGGKPKTLDEIGKEMGLTKERIRQINQKALKKMRSEMINNSITETIYK